MHEESPRAPDRSESELEEWLAVLHPELAAGARATEAEAKLALWARLVAGAAGRELLQAEVADGGRSSIAAR